MPSTFDHEQTAAANEAFYAKLGGKSAAESGWAMTLLFYAAVNHVQAFFRVQGEKPFPRSHETRLQLLASKYPALEPLYRSLKDASEAARYDCASFTPAQLTLAEKQLKDLKHAINALSP